MRATHLLLSLLLAASVAAAELGPFSAVGSKEEAAKAFAGVERALQLKDASNLRPLFKQWQQRFNIEYTADEVAQRCTTFEANVRRIIAINKDAKTSHWAGLTRFAAMTAAEARASLLSPDIVPTLPKPSPPSASLKAGVPSKKDWEAEGKLTKPKDQGNCGSCWALSGVAAIEAQIKIQTGRDVDLSEQQVLDCHPTAWACWGGWLDAAFTYAASTPLVPESGYPYTVGGCMDPAEGDNTCFENRCPTSPQVCRNCRVASAPAGPRYQLTGTGFGRTAPGSKDDLMQAVASKGPTAVAMLVDDDFWLYSGGIYTKPEGSCGPTNAVDHSVLVVGYDSSGATPYWKIRNTWGDGWGEGGYFRMSMEGGKVGPCQIYAYGGYYSTAVTITGLDPQLSPPVVMPSPPVVPSPPAVVPSPPAVVPSPPAVVPSPPAVVPAPSSEPTAPLRLVRGSTNSMAKSSLTQGRLEVLRSDAWGTVCSASFTHTAASVACRQMGKGSAGYAVAASVYGSAAASAKAWMGGVACTGTEARLQDCTFPGWAQTSCSHAEDVGVTCGLFRTRLVYARGTPLASRTYRLEALFNGKWGTFCNTAFTATDAGVVCRSAGLGSGGRVVQLSASSRPRAGAASQRIWLGGPGCTGGEEALQQCLLPGLVGQSGCSDHSADVGVQCYTEGGAAAPVPTRSKALRPALRAVKA